jgi:hypothetical protein
MENFISFYKSLGPKKQTAKDLLSRLGEFLAATELTKRGYLVDYVANMRLKSTIGADLIATSLKTGKHYEIQIKTKVGKESDEKSDKAVRGWYFLKTRHRIGEPLGFNGWYIFVWICEDTGKIDYFIANSSEIFEFADKKFKEWLEKHPSANKTQPLMISVSQLSDYKNRWDMFESGSVAF